MSFDEPGIADFFLTPTPSDINLENLEARLVTAFAGEAEGRTAACIIRWLRMYSGGWSGFNEAALDKFASKNGLSISLESLTSIGVVLPEGALLYAAQEFVVICEHAPGS